VPYPLPKLDLVGVPNFQAGAMENWCAPARVCCAVLCCAARVRFESLDITHTQYKHTHHQQRQSKPTTNLKRGLITYREARMLVDPAENDAAQELRIGTIVAHEAAHQWFGDLVTLSDWTELWLNEGFASYFEYVGASRVWWGGCVIEQERERERGRVFCVLFLLSYAMTISAPKPDGKKHNNNRRRRVPAGC
jgi:hypothetical protein